MLNMQYMTTPLQPNALAEENSRDRIFSLDDDYIDAIHGCCGGGCVCDLGNHCFPLSASELFFFPKNVIQT